ncbi:hypothetical protein [Mesorhizobium sp. M0118]|uniref:class I SAM-dependent methyltransferase n=1 Tax=Mesorhizobium sp. M0118 TaxID=2956884 RepID=UPI00333638D2
MAGARREHGFRLKELLGKRFDQEVQFFKGWQKDKKGVGALIPTSIYAARRMASVVNPRSGMPILELGAGTGVITKAILERGIKPHQLVSVEYSRNFYDGLVQRFSGVDFRLGNAFQFYECRLRLSSNRCAHSGTFLPPASNPAKDTCKPFAMICSVVNVTLFF